MKNQSSLTPLEYQIKALLDVPEPDAAFLENLRHAILKEPVRKQTPRWQPAWRWVMAVLILLTGLAFFFAIGPERVYAAVRNWLGGFIPGIGFVDPDQRLRILEKPVRKINPDGAALEVLKVLAYPDVTAVQVSFTGNDSRTCNGNPLTSVESFGGQITEGYLLLPDGQKLPLDPAKNTFGAGWGVFPPLPAAVNDVTLNLSSNLYIPCPSGEILTGKCRCREDDLNWQVPLKLFVPAPGAVLPVMESATATPLPVTPTVQTYFATSLSEVSPDEPQPEMFAKLIPVEDGYLIAAIIKKDTQDNNVTFRFNRNGQTAHLIDAAGTEIPIEQVNSNLLNTILGDDFPGLIASDSILYRARTRPASLPLTMIFPTIIRQNFNLGKEADFRVNIGKDIAVGKRIPQPQDLSFIPGHPFALRELSIESVHADQIIVIFNFEGANFETVAVKQLDQPVDSTPENPFRDQDSAGSSGKCDHAQSSVCFYNERALKITPDGWYALRVEQIGYIINGPWRLTFTPDRDTGLSIQGKDQ